MRVAIAIIVALAVLAPANRASGADEVGVQVEHSLAGVFPSEAAAYSEAYGVSVVEATRRLAMQGAAGALQESLGLGLPDRFAGLWIDNGPAYRVVVRLTDGPPVSMDDYTSDVALLGVVELEQADRTLGELTDVGQSFRDLAVTTPFDVEVNIYDNLVDVRVADRGAFSSFLSGHGAALPDSARIVDVEALVEPATDLVGGMIFGSCTTGFGIRDNERGTRGVVTAGHCPNDITMKVCCPLTVLPFVAPEAYFGSHDEQWHAPQGWIVKNQIKINTAGALRNILAVRFRSQQAIGSQVFMFGSVSSDEAGILLSNTAAPGGVPNANLTFMRATAGIPNYTMVRPGDSGGPVYYGNVAYGIIQGRQLIQVPNDSHYDLIYTAADFVQAGLDISILTTCC